MRLKIVYISALVSFLFLNLHCSKDKLISPVPQLTYTGYYKVPYQNNNFDSVVIVEMDFQDGDGDFGLSLKDTMSPFRIGEPYFYNVFAEYLEGKNGVYTYQVTGTDTLSFNDRVADLKPETRNKTIIGTISLKISPTINSIIPDSIKLNVFIVDKALNKSNVLNIGPIPVNF